MKIPVVSLMLLLVLSSSSFALTPSVIGGVRGGLALGLMADEAVKNNIGVRFGAEVNTTSNPLLLFFGGKFHLTNISGRYPLAFGAGLIGYFGGRNSDVGISVSLIFDKPFDISPLFIEGGIDVAGSAKIQLQAGYKI